MAKRSSRPSSSSRVDTSRLAAALIVILIGLVALVLGSSAFMGTLSLNTLLIALGTLWLAAVTVLSSITRSRINGVEPQTALISFGLAWPVSASTFSIVFLLTGIICVFLWARRGFRL